jgi:hypothetical protein
MQVLLDGLRENYKFVAYDGVLLPPWLLLLLVVAGVDGVWSVEH